MIPSTFPSHLFNEINGGLEIQTKVDELPVDALSAVLLLLLNEHVMVEELLEPLVGVINAQLLKRVDSEDLKTSNIKNTDEIVLASLNQNFELKVYNSDNS